MAEVFVIVFLVVLILIPLIFYRREQSLKGTSDFDERQELLRGKAFRHAFLTVVGYSAAYIVMQILFENRPFMEDGVSTMIACFLGITVFSVECIWRDAFFTAGNRPRGYIILIAVVALLQGVVGLDKLREGQMVRNGLLTMDSIQLVCAITFLVELIALVAKWFVSRREARE